MRCQDIVDSDYEILAKEKMLKSGTWHALLWRNSKTFLGKKFNPISGDLQRASRPTLMVHIRAIQESPFLRCFPCLSQA